MLRRLAVLLAAAAAVLVLAAPARAAGGFTSCPAPAGVAIVGADGVDCATAQAVAAQAVAAGPGALDAVRAAGFTPIRAAGTAAPNVYDLLALRGSASLRLRLAGAVPDLDGFAGGRELLFAPGHLVGGQPIPNGSALCTSAFLVRIRGHRGGLSAGHCAGISKRTARTVRRQAALRRPPQPGIVLGTVQRVLERTRPLDALVLPIPSGADRPAQSLIERGISRPPCG